jgi:hypothetical protein
VFTKIVAVPNTPAMLHHRRTEFLTDSAKDGGVDAQAVGRIEPHRDMRLRLCEGSAITA